MLIELGQYKIPKQEFVKRMNKYVRSLRILKSRVCNDFCERCPERENKGCKHLQREAIVIASIKYGRVSKKRVNEFNCPYNTERLVYGK